MMVHNEGARHAFAQQVHVARGTAAGLVGAAVSAFAGVAATVVLSRRLGFDDLGLYSLGFAACLFVAMCSRLGLEISTVRFPSAHLTRGDLAVASGSTWRALRLSVTLGIVGGAALFVLAPLIASTVGQPAAAGVLRLFSPAVPLVNVLFLTVESVRAAQRIVDSLVPRLVIFPGILILGFVTVLERQRTLEAAVYVTIAAWFTAALVAFLFFVRTYPRFPGPVRRDSLLHFGAWSLAMQFLQFGIFWMPVLLLAYFSDSTETGLIRVASQTALMATVPLTASEGMFAPVCSAFLTRRDHAGLAATSKSVARTTFLVTGTFALGALVAPGFVLSIFGPNVGRAVPAFVILIAAQTLGTLLGPAPHAFIMGDRVRHEVASNLAGLVIGAALGWWLVPARGLEGAAWAAAAALLVRTCVRGFYLQRAFHLVPLSPRLVVGAVALVVLYLAGTLAIEVLGAHAVPVAVVAGAVFLAGGLRWIASGPDRLVLLETVSWATPVTSIAATAPLRVAPEDPTISVIVCTRNRPDHALSLLRLLPLQTRPADEIVVVDGSPDGTLEARLPHGNAVRYVHVPDSPGLTVQRNAGVRAAKSDICLFLDDDAVPEPEFLAAILGAYRDHPDAGGVGGVPVVDRRLSPFRRSFIKIFQRGPFQYPKAFYGEGPRIPARVHRLSGCAQSYWREVLRAIPFDETIVRPQRGEDMDISWRVSQQYAVYLVPGARLKHDGLGWRSLDLAERFQAKALSYRSLYAKNLRGSWRMRVFFFWLMTGIAGEAFLYSVVKGSIRPLSGFGKGLRIAVVASSRRPGAATVPATGTRSE